MNATNEQPRPQAQPPEPDAAVLDAFGVQAQSIRRCDSGLINLTWRVRTWAGDAAILQRVNPMFPPEIHANIEAVTAHLGAKDVPTPRLLRTRAGRLYLEHGGSIWRLQTYMEGTCLHAVRTPGQAQEAGRVLGRFHRAVQDLEHDFRGTRLGVHDTARHLAALEAALEDRRDHEEFEAVRPLAEEVLAFAGRLPALPPARERVVHGDPKISNVVFAPDGARAVCLIDLDTLGHMPVALELGDAFRSWCNPGAEDSADAAFSLELFAAALAGYADGSRGLLEAPEREAIPDATAAIAVELAARFCADALHERYFGWDPGRYPSASRHNQARARGQLALARSIFDRRDALRALVARAFGAAP